MTIPLPAGQTPYVTADQLLSGMWPTGSPGLFSPPGRTVTEAERFAPVSTLCGLQGTPTADGYCNLPLRCTLTTEVFHCRRWRCPG